jgi:uncharacterized membrane protein YkoI
VRRFGIMVLAGLIGLSSLSGAEARERRRVVVEDSYGLVDGETMADDGYDQLAQQDDYGIRPSEAAAIARQVVPGAKVVGVKLLSNGYYAVTLRAKGSVTRVLVNASDGSVR